MALSTCTVNCTIHNLLDQVPGDLATSAPKLYIRNNETFMHGNVLVGPFEVSAAFNTSNGTVSLPVIETTTPNKSLEVYITIGQGTSTLVIPFTKAIIPNTASVNLGEICIVKKDF